ncbi:CotH kinase family protein [Limosilactobacillus reuteri]|uniref:CotH kinase family protein n=2 Tax=Limosilactobacillus reuteri TaxID=1598 RepID=UPI001E617441|nr:CotH kinase family protein [Limosilactobacillus reuteri]MCC4344909.1 CotH kinase family protein [Limosilactobacillus reuteri]MCC4356975.1 CotH kinase family protein [Limosilactobacillus reuteri]
MQTQVVTLDVLKPIGTTVDLSDSFNARVGDKMTPFQLFITEGGVAKDLKGMHPELEAEVGNGALRNGVAVMAAGAKGVHWVGSTNNVTGYNQLTLAFPAEVFPQSGFCYGHLILANDAGVRETSVDIWFQVLDGTPLMGLVADHYDSELQLELAKAKNANDQFSQEMRDTYNQQVTDAQNALTRATANLSSLAGTAGNIEAQITAQDIITRPEYDKLANQITDTLSKMNLKPEYYADLNAVQAKYPNGSDNFIVTSDGYLALYQNGQWTKGPLFQAAGLSDNVQAKLSTINPRNLIVNANFADGMQHWYAYGNGTVTVNGDSLNISAKGLTDDGWATATSEPIKVVPGQLISEAVNAIWKPVDANVDGATLTVNYYADSNGNGDRLAYESVNISATRNYLLTSLENKVVPDNVQSARLVVQLKRNGDLTITKPIFVYGKFVNGYDLEDIDTWHRDGRNLLMDPNFKHSDAFWNTDKTAQIKFVDYYEGHRAMTIETHNNAGASWKSFYSNNFIVLPGEHLSWKSLLKWIPDDPATDHFVLTLNFFDTMDSTNRIDYKQYTLSSTQGYWHQFGEDEIIVPDTAMTANLMVQIYKNGFISICMPLVVVGNQAGQYAIDNDLKHVENFVTDTEFTDDSQWTHEPSQINLVKHGYQGHNVRKMEVHGSTTNVWYSDETRRFKVDGGSLIDAYMDINFVPDEEFSDPALLVINEYLSQDPNDGRINYYSKIIHGTNDVFATFGQNGYKLQPQTQYVSIQIELQRNGKLEYAQPVIRYHKEPQQTSDNLVALNNVKFVDVDNATNLGLTYFPNYYHGHDAIRFTQSVGDNATSSSATFNKVPLENSKVASALSYMKWLPSADNAYGLIVMDFLDENYQRISYEATHNKFNGKLELIKITNAQAPANAKYVDLHIELTGPGQLWVLQPKLSLSKQVAPSLDERINQYDTKTDLPIISLVGNTDGMNKDTFKLLKFDYWNGNQHIEGFADTKWQGDSSLNLPKKNYRIKLYKDAGKKDKLKIKPQATWQEDSKFNLKANFADATMARNIINSRLAADVTATRHGLPDEIIKAPNFATVDGFPVHVYVNYFDCGIYTFNLTKDIFGNAEAGVTGDVYCPATLFNADFAKYDTTDFEWLTDNPTEADKNSFNNLLKFVHTSSDEDFKAHLDDYISLGSAIDYLVFNNIIGNTDCWGKNAEYVTYDGKKWYCLFYDLDISYGSTWNGASTDANVINKAAGVFYSAAEGPNLLFKRVNELFTDRVKARYQELRQWLTPVYVINKYRNFMDSIGETNYKLDQDMWNTTSKGRYTFAQLQEYIYKRFQILDSIWNK